MDLFIVEKSHCVTTEQKLLWNIKEILIKKESPLIIQQEATKEVKETKKINCKGCGGTHDNMGAMLACCRNKKKESG